MDLTRLREELMTAAYRYFGRLPQGDLREILQKQGLPFE